MLLADLIGQYYLYYSYSTPMWIFKRVADLANTHHDANMRQEYYHFEGD
jgi:hypothetical protein